ncbi:alpha/beta-hydrolase [Hysterangium stoloniferum]|nr:alpha/beta-hydrolase [Hysterangium stoloniferum]
MVDLIGFVEQITPVSSGAHIFSYFRRSPAVAKGTNLPVLVLLHGFPQNSLMWKTFVEEIPGEYSVFVPDLPGYGKSTKAASPSGDSLAHSKREWAKDIIEAIDIVVGLTRSGDLVKVVPYGHDRGGRLAYRLALDFPDRVSGAGVLDIVPTPFVWGNMKLENNTHRETKSSWHWVFLSSPRPFPETLISSNAEFFFNNLIQRWTGADTQDSPNWMSDAVKQYTDLENGKDRVVASCEDYRAGATHDIEHDLQAGVNPANPSRVFKIPLLVLSSMHLLRRFAVGEIWESLASEGLVTNHQVGGEGTGHFLVNEAQSEVGQRTRDWLKENWSV